MSKLALLVALATMMSAVESLIQSPLPFLRLGLANGITLLVLKWSGLRQGLFVTLARVLLAGLIIGRLFQPAFFLSLCGGLSAALIMAAVLKWGSRWFSLIGVSILGAVFHNLTQWMVASLLIHRFIGIFILPVLFMVSLISGILIGYFAWLVDHTMMKHPGWSV